MDSTLLKKAHVYDPRMKILVMVVIWVPQFHRNLGRNVNFSENFENNVIVSIKLYD